MSNYQIWTLSDEKVELDERGDNLIEYISADISDAYPDSGVVDGYYYIKIFSPDVTVQANKMLKGVIACGQNGQIEGTIESIASQKNYSINFQPNNSRRKISCWRSIN